MGGGTSKPADGGKGAEEATMVTDSTSAKSIDGKEQERKQSTNVTITPQIAAPVEEAHRLVCTVEDSKTNSYVPFVSSVKDESREQTITSDDVITADSQSFTDGDITGDQNRVVFGDVSIDLGRPLVSSPKTQLSPNRRGSPTTDRPPGPGDQGIRINGLHTVGDLWKHASASDTHFVDPIAGGLPMGDLRVQAPNPRTASVSTWFGAPTRYAVPYKYTFAAFSAQSGPIRCLSASAEANQVAVVVSGGKQCYLLDLQGNLLMSVKGHLDPVLSCAQSKDGKFLVTTSADCTAVMWDLNNGKKLRELPVSTQVNCVTVSDESDAIATTSTDDVVHLWDSKSCDPLIMFQRHTAGIFSMAFSRRGGMIASGSSNGEIYVWAQATGEVRNFLSKHKTPVLAVSFSHDSQRLCSVDRETLRVWDLFTGQCIFCRDTKGNLTYGVDEDHGMTRQPAEDNVRYTCCAFIAGHLIATALTSKLLLLVDPNEGKELLSLSTKALVTSLSPSWMGDVLFVGDFCGNLYRLELVFSNSDVQAFHLDSKPPTKEKRGSSVEKD